MSVVAHKSAKDYWGDFASDMAAAGLGITDLPIDDGQLHRYHVEGDKIGSKNGWYCLYGDGVPAGSYGSWKTCEKFNWCAKPQRDMSTGELEAHRKRLEASKQQRKADQAKVHREAASACISLWDKANPTVNTQHPYLIAKGIPAIGIRQLGESLLIPVRDKDGILTSLQFINGDGSKRFKTGGKVQGCYTHIGTPTDTVYIVEGFATGVTIHQATGSIVVVAFNVGNLGAVTQAIKEKYPDKTLIICADNDTETENNPGIEAAKEASSQFDVAWTYPEMGGAKCDFNDLHQRQGIDAVTEQITKNLQLPPNQQQDDVSLQCSPTDSDEGVELERLAQLSEFEYDRQRKEVADRLGLRVNVLDKAVSIRRKELEGDIDDGLDELSNGIEPWDHPINGLEIVRTVNRLLRRYTILPSGGYDAVTLWIFGSYVYDAFRIFPKLCLSSPEKRCGKTTLLETMGSLVNRSLITSNMSPAAIFRSVEAWKPSLLIDEGDTFLRGNEELRGIINSGHTRSTAFVLRVEEVGGVREPKRFSTWAPMAIAMIKTPPDTILDRSVLISLRRKMPSESVTRLPLDLFSECRDTRRKIQRWALDHMDKLKASTPQIPKVGSDRAEDNWWPLLAIADALGGEWAELARSAMTKLEAGKGDDDGIGPMVLSDIQQVFSDADRMYSQDLVDRLNDMEDRPWCEWKHGRPMTKNSLSRLLTPFGVKSKDIRGGRGVKRGYEKEHFRDAFSRYLGPTPNQSATALQTSNCAGYSVALGSSDSVDKNQSATPQPSDDGGCSTVALQKASERKMEPEGEEFDL